MDTLIPTPQLTLNMGLRAVATLKNFYGNEQLIHDLNRSVSDTTPSFIYLWGDTHSGRTHLAHAYCHQAEQAKLTWMYLPLAEIVNYTPAILENLENYRVLVLDDLDVLTGKPDWEEALFHLYNRSVQTQQHLLFTANCSPAQLLIQLPDLLSRLKSATIFKLKMLDEKEKLAALTTRAHERGWPLPLEVGEFLLRRWPRDLAALFTALDNLDHASLQQQRRVTIPFAKEVLGL
jgi:DnaA-homolog protein